MNGLLILPFLCAAVSFALGAFVFTRNPRSAVHRSFAFFCFWTFYWQACWFATYFFDEPLQKDLIMRLAYIDITFLPVTYYHYAVRFLGRDREWPFVRMGYLVGLLVFMPLLWMTKLYIAGYIDHWWGYYPKVGALHPIYLIASLTIVARTLFILHAGATNPELTAGVRNRNRFAFYAHFIYSLAVVEYAITYGVIDIYPVGVFALLGAMGITAYAIVQHHLMDIRVAVTRGAIFLVLQAVAIGLPFFIAVSCKDWLKAVAGEWWWALPFGLQSLLTLVAPGLYRFFQYHAEERLLKKERRYQAAIRTMAQEMVGFADVKSLGDYVGQFVGEQMSLNFADLYVQRNGLGIPHRPTNTIPDPVKIVLERWMTFPTRAEGCILAEESGTGRADTELRTVRRWMRRSGISAVVPGWLRGELVSCLILGSKQTGGIFTPEDLEVLEALSRQSALVVKNLELADEVHEQKRLAQLAELTFAVTHEFNNLLADQQEPLLTMAKQLANPTALQAGIEDLHKLIQRGAYITKAASAYKNKSTTPLTTHQLALVVTEAFTQAQQTQFAGSEAAISLIRAVDPTLSLEGNATIPLLFLNLFYCLGWACEMKHEAGALSIEATQEGQDSVVIRLVMQGGADPSSLPAAHGLAEELGKHGGLYLVVARLIVKDHQGQLTLETTPGGGTTFVIRLPQRQPDTSPLRKPLPQISIF